VDNSVENRKKLIKNPIKDRKTRELTVDNHVDSVDTIIFITEKSRNYVNQKGEEAGRKNP